MDPRDVGRRPLPRFLAESPLLPAGLSLVFFLVLWLPSVFMG